MVRFREAFSLTNRDCQLGSLGAVLCRLLVVVLLTTGVWGGVAHAATDAQQFLKQVEARFYLTQYEKEPLEKRLSRVETTVFGQAQDSLSVPERVAKLEAVVGQPEKAAEPLSPLNPQPAKSVQNKNAQKTVTQPPTTQQPMASQGNGPLPTMEIPPEVVNSLPAPSVAESDYPAVTAMEQKVLGKAYPTEELSKRLDRLDDAVFKTRQMGSLSDRTDSLRLAVLGDTTLQQPNQAAQTPPNYNPYNPYQAATPGVYSGPRQPVASSNWEPVGASAGNPSYNAPPGAVSPDVQVAIAEVEQQLFKNTYPQEPVDARLDRLENQVFGSTSPELGAEERLQRVMAVAAAGGHEAASTKAKAASTFKTMLPIILMVLPMLLL